MQPQRRLSDAVAAACRDVTPQKRGPAAKSLDEVLPQKWRQPAAMVAAATTLLLFAPMFWAHSSDATQVAAPTPAVSRRHLQQPSRTSPSGAGASAERMSPVARILADQHDAQHANDPLPQRQKVPPYLPPDSKFQPLVAQATLWEKLTARAWGRQRSYPEGHVALCLTVKDQEADMAEWLEWHQLIGVSRVYVFDMGSSPPLNQTLQPYIESGLVDYHWVNGSMLPAKGEAGKMPPQLAIYDICIKEFRHRHMWMGFFDADEFLLLRDRTMKLSTFLKAYEQHGGLAVSWEVFGSSDYEVRPLGGNMKSYWKCLDHSSSHARHTKMLVNLRFGDRPYKDPHTFTYTHGRRAVNERFAFVDGPVHAYHTSQKIVLHHYVSKSMAENQEKMSRGSAMLNRKHGSFFNAINAEATRECWDGVHAARELGFWPDRPAAYPQLDWASTADPDAAEAAGSAVTVSPLAQSAESQHPDSAATAALAAVAGDPASEGVPVPQTIVEATQRTGSSDSDGGVTSLIAGLRAVIGPAAGAAAAAANETEEIGTGKREQGMLRESADLSARSVGSDARQHSHESSIDALIAALAGSDGARAGASNDGRSPPQVQQAADVQQAGATGLLSATADDSTARR